MPIPIQNFSGSEPNVRECRTEYIVHDFSRCLSNNSTCKYAIPAGSTSTYCLHPEHGSFWDNTKSPPRQEPKPYRAPRRGEAPHHPS